MSERTEAVEWAVKKAVEDARAGVDVFDAADNVLTTLDPEAIRFLAKAALVDAVRRAQRDAVRQVERQAEQKPAPPSRPEPDWRESPEYIAKQREISDRFWRKTIAIMEEYAVLRHTEWTAELLGSEIALPDGTRTTWGEATIVQHEIRREMFMQNAIANTEGAARHESAIRDLRKSGFQTLGEMVGVAA